MKVNGELQRTRWWRRKTLSEREPLEVAADTDKTVHAALRIESASVSFGGIRALTDVSFSVPQGGFTAVIGPNGAGKTTLFNVICGYHRGEGEIYKDGRRIDLLPAHERAGIGIGRTFQTPTLIDAESALHNIMLGSNPLLTSGVFRSFFALPGVHREEGEAEERATQLLERFGLTKVGSTPVGDLPHRQRRLVEIARSLAGDPTILLLDEPAAGSHHSEAVVMLEQVTEYCAGKGIAVVLVEHNVQLVMQFAKDVVVLNFGEVLAQGSPSTIQKDPRVISAYLGEAA